MKYALIGNLKRIANKSYTVQQWYVVREKKCRFKVWLKKKKYLICSII